MSVSTVYACVTIRAQDVSRCTPRVFRRDARGKRVQVKPDAALKSRPVAPAVAKLFLKPNRAQTWFEWMEQQSIAHLLRGNAYAPVRRDSRGQPVELIPVNPDAVLVLEAADGGVFYNVNRIGLWQMAMLRDFPAGDRRRGHAASARPLLQQPGRAVDDRHGARRDRPRHGPGAAGQPLDGERGAPVLRAPGQDAADRGRRPSGSSSSSTTSRRGSITPATPSSSRRGWSRSRCN